MIPQFVKNAVPAKQFLDVSYSAPVDLKISIRENNQTYKEDPTVLKWIKNTTVLVTLLTLFIIVAPAHAELDDESLVLYLSFDEGAGNKAKDGTDYGHDGDLITNPAWVDGQFDSKALEFDGGKQQYVMVPINDTLQLREQFSVAFWVKRGNNQAAVWNYMVAAGNLKWAVIFNNNDQKTYVYTRTGGAWDRRGISDGIQPDDWVHIYYDGKKAGGGGKPPIVDEIDGSIMVGARHPGEEYFTGTIDEVFLFNRIISEAEINTIMDGGYLPVEPAEKLAYDLGCY